MKSAVEKKLEALGLNLPDNNGPAANYIAYRRSGNIVYISGQTPKWNGELVYRGAVGNELSVEDGVKAAQLCALNLLLQLKEVCQGNLDLVKKCMNLSVFINSDSKFEKHAYVANGASDVFIKTMGEKGQHSRASTGSVSLPGRASVEVMGVFELEEVV